MQTTARLLLPFTQSINMQALNYAVHVAHKRQATLVPLALITVRPKQKARLEALQQAQDFLELVRHKAGRYGVLVEPQRIFTGDVARSIDAIAGEMECEAVLIFLCNTDEVLLEHTIIRALMDSSCCNVYTILFPERGKRQLLQKLLHMPFLRRADDHSSQTERSLLFAEEAKK